MPRPLKKLLTAFQMSELTTSRLLAYRDRLLAVHEGPNEGESVDSDISKKNPEWQRAYDACKAILAKREHVKE
jgi:hypothetical protein